HRHLAKAKERLAAVSIEALSGDARKRLARLRMDVDELAVEYAGQPLPSAATDAPKSTQPSSSKSNDWMLKIDDSRTKSRRGPKGRCHRESGHGAGHSGILRTTSRN